MPARQDSTVHTLAGVLDSTIVVQGFDGGALTYDPTIPDEFNTLNVMSPGFGYWLKMKCADTLVYPATIPPIPVVTRNIPLASNLRKTEASVVPTRQWISIWGKGMKLNGELIPVGTVVKAVDKDGATCGEFTVAKAGDFGLMPIYADDPDTRIEEGPKPGEYVSIYIGNFEVPAPIKWTEFGDIVNFNDVVTALGGELGNLPKTFELHQNYPNPFKPSTTIKYDLPKQENVVLKIYNVLGQEVVTLVNQKEKAGYYSVEWNGMTRSGFASSGVYFCVIHAGSYNKTIKMLMVK